jgi:hypothetical protein
VTLWADFADELWGRRAQPETTWTVRRQPSTVSLPDKVSKEEGQHDLPLFFHHCSCLSLFDRLIYDIIVGLGKPIIVALSLGIHRPPDCAALLSGYSPIVPDLRTGLPEYQHLR